MTKEEFIDKYGDVMVTFSYYWKYTFTYRAELPNNTVIYVTYGGDSNDIYRHEVTTDPFKLSALYPNSGSVVVDGVEVDSFDDRY